MLGGFRKRSSGRYGEHARWCCSGRYGEHARWWCPKELTVLRVLLPLRWTRARAGSWGCTCNPLLFRISRLAVLDRRLPCFHLLAAQGLAGCGCHGGVGKAGTCGRVSGVWIVPAGWLRARPPNGRQAIRVGRARWYGSPEAGSCAAYPFRGSGPLDVSLHPAPSNGRRRTTEHTPRTTEPSSVAWRAGTCDALGPSERRGRGLTSQSR